MTRNKAYNIRLLCKYRGIELDSLEAQEFEDWSVLQLLNAIREARLNPQGPKVADDGDDDEDESLISRAGSRY